MVGTVCKGCVLVVAQKLCTCKGVQFAQKRCVSKNVKLKSLYVAKKRCILDIERCMQEVQHPMFCLALVALWVPASSELVRASSRLVRTSSCPIRARPRQLPPCIAFSAFPPRPSPSLSPLTSPSPSPSPHYVRHSCSRDVFSCSCPRNAPNLSQICTNSELQLRQILISNGICISLV